MTRSLTPVSDRVSACEPEVAARVRPYGQRVLAAPIATTANNWGVVLVVQRHGSLFPDDDLRLLAQFGSYAAMSLDHGHLIAETRERERRAADRRLREAESRMSLMLDSIKDYAMFVLDHGGRVISWNAGAERITGYSAQEVQGRHVSLFYPQAAIEKKWPEQELALAREHGRFEGEAERVRKDGATFSASVLVTPL